MASLSTCHLGLWLGWQILLNLVKDTSREREACTDPCVTGLGSHTDTTNKYNDKIQVERERPALTPVSQGWGHTQILQISTMTRYK